MLPSRLTFADLEFDFVFSNSLALTLESQS